MFLDSELLCDVIFQPNLTDTITIEIILEANSNNCAFPFLILDQNPTGSGRDSWGFVIMHTTVGNDVAVSSYTLNLPTCNSIIWCNGHLDEGTLEELTISEH